MDYWHKQTVDKPLFPDLLWSRPENRQQAGKLLVIGGNKHGFAAAGEGYVQSLTAGVGLTRVLLPDALKSTAGKLLETVAYAPSTPSGSFAQKALAELLDQAAWADGVLLAGDLGRNSETAILLEKFVGKHHGQLTITKDAADYFTEAPKLVLERPDTLLVITMAQLQKLAAHSGFPTAFTFSMDLLQLIEASHSFTLQYPVAIIIKHLDQMIVAVKGQVSTTKLSQDLPVWRVATAARASVWWLQNPTKPFAGLTTAVVAPMTSN
jgi:NAD(P)H-hydrate repair Nnr-like enzyme with NAD(P)H-hydrate dehydratase domain